MSDVIEFLERVGQDAQLSRGVGAAIGSALISSGLNPDFQEAIRVKDRTKLDALMGVVPVCGFLAPGEEQEGEDDAEETPSEGEDEAHSASATQSLD
ncbi:MAG TPA: hypothetical protein VIO59_07460 [Rhodanobacter sp.]